MISQSICRVVLFCFVFPFLTSFHVCMLYGVCVCVSGFIIAAYARKGTHCFTITKKKRCAEMRDKVRRAHIMTVKISDKIHHQFTVLYFNKN